MSKWNKVEMTLRCIFGTSLCVTVRRRLVVVKRERESTSLFLTLRHITIFEDWQRSVDGAIGTILNITRGMSPVKIIVSIVFQSASKDYVKVFLSYHLLPSDKLSSKIQAVDYYSHSLKKSAKSLLSQSSHDAPATLLKYLLTPNRIIFQLWFFTSTVEGWVKIPLELRSCEILYADVYPFVFKKENDEEIEELRQGDVVIHRTRLLESLA